MAFTRYALWGTIIWIVGICCVGKAATDKLSTPEELNFNQFRLTGD